MKKFLLKAVAATVITLGSASAALAGDCSPNEFADNGQVPSFADLTGVNVSACAGFYTGNAVNAGNATALGLLNSVLAGWGLAPVDGWIEKIDFGQGHDGRTVDFDMTLTGDTVVAFHWGNFPGDKEGAGNVSAIYRFNAGEGVDVFSIFESGGLSNGAVYVSSPVTPPIPEPSTYALMLAGLGVIGFVSRRRRQT